MNFFINLARGGLDGQTLFVLIFFERRQVKQDLLLDRTGKFDLRSWVLFIRLDFSSHSREIPTVISKKFIWCIGKTPHCGVDLSTPVGNLGSAFGSCVSALDGRGRRVLTAVLHSNTGAVLCGNFGSGNYARTCWSAGSPDASLRWSVVGVGLDAANRL